MTRKWLIVDLTQKSKYSETSLGNGKIKAGGRGAH